MRRCRLRGLLDTAQSTNHAFERDVRRLLEKLGQVTGFESTYLTRIDWEAQTQEIVIARNTGSLRIEEGARVAWGQTACRSMLEGGPRATGNVQRDYPDSATAASLGLNSYAGIPIRDPDGGVLGTLCAASTARRQLDERTIRVMELFADMLTDTLTWR